jgi:hypothetical protein
MDKIITVGLGLKIPQADCRMESDQEICSRLKFLGKLNKGEKVNTRHVFAQQNDIFTRISRTLFYRENRWTTLVFVQNIITRAFQLIKLHKQSGLYADRVLCLNIIEDIKKSKTGIANLRNTYGGDTKMCCDLDTIIQDIDSQLHDLEVEINSNIIRV